ncbi:unnamed protein product, partial [Dicrocoelium dendriticum]
MLFYCNLASLTGYKILGSLHCESSIRSRSHDDHLYTVYASAVSNPVELICLTRDAFPFGIQAHSPKLKVHGNLAVVHAVDTGDLVHTVGLQLHSLILAVFLI